MSRKNQIFIVAIIALVIGIAAAVPPLSYFFIDHSVDMLFKVRGDRPASPDILFLYIDADDITALSGWPISRDYYGYLIYLLKKAGVRTVVIDILFATPHHRYFEYDKALAEFMHSAHNVILPFAIADSDFNTSEHLSSAASLQRPIKPFRDAAAAMGFANLANEPLVRRSPLMVQYQDTVMASLGLEAAAHFLLGDSVHFKPTRHGILMENGRKVINIPTDIKHRLYLNHFRDIHQFSLSLVDALKILQSHPDTINFRDKLVFLGVTAPGNAPQKMTPLHNAFPASLIHLTAAENIIESNYLRLTPSWLALLLSIGAGMTGFLLHNLPRKTSYILLASISIFYPAITYYIFKFIFIVLPIFPPLTAFTICAALPFIFSTHQRLESETALRKLYQQQTEEKQLQLSQSEESLRQIHAQLQNHHALSHESQRLIFEKESEIYRLEQQLKDLQAASVSAKSQISTAFPHIIHAGDSKLIPLLELVVKIGADDIPVLLTGETGVGKELFARAIHQAGKRVKNPFIAVNCGALAETLLESELFGHEKGAFTGAVSQRKGRFELANEGTLFLDEITETTSAFQAKLLRVLQDGCFERLGGEKTIKTNVRIIAASSRKILQQVLQGEFREDLFYRLNGFMLELPPLRERTSDIP
ncbi:MAG: CHASE2 domain-containing protein, partial [Calditrichaeota bacterium]